MKINVDFESRIVELTFSTGEVVTFRLNLLKQFLLANLLCTITWMVTEKKELFIKELQDAIDSAEEAEQSIVPVVRDMKVEHVNQKKEWDEKNLNA